MTQRTMEELMQELNDALLQAFGCGVNTASGEQLDKLAEGVGIMRQPASEAITVCQHEWVDYYGLKECFKYCKKCDQKQ